MSLETIQLEEGLYLLLVESPVDVHPSVMRMMTEIESAVLCPARDVSATLRTMHFLFDEVGEARIVVWCNFGNDEEGRPLPNKAVLLGPFEDDAGTGWYMETMATLVQCNLHENVGKFSVYPQAGGSLEVDVDTDT